MSLKSSIFLVSIMVFVSISRTAGRCFMEGFYSELGCTPAQTTKNDSCAEAFICPMPTDKTKCYYEGVSYEKGQSVPESLSPVCSKACSCQTSPKPRFDCAMVDCVDTIDEDEIGECIMRHDINECCATKFCGKDAIAALKTCEVDGKTYKEGQFIDTTNGKNCICTADFNGSLDNPAYCSVVRCGLFLHYQDMLRSNCAPVFYGLNGNCPISFICQSDRVKVKRGKNFNDVNYKCDFGNMQLNVGDELAVEEKCTKCTCQVPPITTCIKTC